MEINAREQLSYSIQGTERRVQQLREQPDENKDRTEAEERELQILKKKLASLPS